VVVTSFKDEPTILRIASEIYVERVSQRAILIGHKGESIKKVGIQARADLEAFFGKKFFRAVCEGRARLACKSR